MLLLEIGAGFSLVRENHIVVAYHDALGSSQPLFHMTPQAVQHAMCSDGMEITGDPRGNIPRRPSPTFAIHVEDATGQKPETHDGEGVDHVAGKSDPAMPDAALDHRVAVHFAADNQSGGVSNAHNSELKEVQQMVVKSATTREPNMKGDRGRRKGLFLHRTIYTLT